MSHLLWKHYWDNDVDRFRRLLAPASAGHHGAGTPRSVPVGSGSLRSPDPSPRIPPPRRASGQGSLQHGGARTGPAGAPLSRAEVNSRDFVGTTVLLRAAASNADTAIHFVRALVDHPAIDLHLQDGENGWNALHRALYGGNMSIARLLLEKESNDLVPAGSAARVGLLIKTKDRDGKSPFDLYHLTIYPWSPMLHPCGLDGSSFGTGDKRLLRVTVEPSRLGSSNRPPDIFTRGVGDELYVFGSNRNLSLGTGDGDDRQYPERIQINRPDHLIRHLYKISLERLTATAVDPAAAIDPPETAPATAPEPQPLSQIPCLTRHCPVYVQDIVMAKFHTAVLTTDPISNLYVCGVGRGGRLGLGHEDTQLRLIPVQAGLTHKHVSRVALGQNHSLALTKDGELWAWGLNSDGQLGYAVTEILQPDPVSTLPRRVYGILKKQTVLGIAASAHHSVAHTGTSLYCWGRNVGQLGLMDSVSRSRQIQPEPRKVAASLFQAPIVMVSATDSATTCLLEQGTVCVFVHYGYKFINVHVPDPCASRVSPPPEPGRKSGVGVGICHITSGGDTIAALDSRGDLFTIRVNSSQSLDNPHSIRSTASTTNPAKIKGAVSDPLLIWTSRKDMIRSVGVSEHGSVVISTLSGAVWRRIKRTRPEDTNVRALGRKSKDFKFQRVPAIANVISVSSSAFGAFAAIRQENWLNKLDNVAGPNIESDIAALCPLHELSSDAHQVLPDHSLPAPEPVFRRIPSGGTPPPFPGWVSTQMFLTKDSRHLEDEVQAHFSRTAARDDHLTHLICTSSAPAVRLPVHGWVLAGRSPVLRAGLARAGQTGSDQVLGHVYKIEAETKKTVVTLVGLSFYALVELVIFLYFDTVVREPYPAPMYRPVKHELIALAASLGMPNLVAAAHDRESTGASALQTDLRSAVRSPEMFADADIMVQLKDGQVVPLHSQLACRRSPFFDALFHGRSGGLWISDRRFASEPVKVDLGHVRREVFLYVRDYLYADVCRDMFSVAVADSLEELQVVILDVISIADELMLDRLSRFCQQFMVRFINIRNVTGLLTELSPFTVTDFKMASLDFIRAQAELLLENHLLDDLDDHLLADLDEVVRNEQLRIRGVAGSDFTERRLLQSYPYLAADIAEERQRRAREFAFKSQQRGEERKLWSNVKSRLGSSADGSLLSPTTLENNKKSKPSGSTQLSPSLRSRASIGDMIFDMDEDESQDAQTTTSALPLLYPRHYSAAGSDPAPPPERKASSSGLDSPWGTSAVPAARPGLRDIMAETLPAVYARPIEALSWKPAHARLSQKERKKQQQQQQQPIEAQLRTDNTAESPSSSTLAFSKLMPEPVSSKKVAPWKLNATANPQTTTLRAEQHPAPMVPTAAVHLRPLIEAKPSKPTPHRIGSTPDTRFSGQKSQTTAAVATAPVPHSRRYIPLMRPSPEPSPELRSMAEIIGQQARERAMVREAAVSKPSLQDIQQEQAAQAFQEWWDEESKKVIEAEARNAAAEQMLHEGSSSGGRGMGRRRRGGGGARSITMPGPTTDGVATKMGDSGDGDGAQETRGE